MITTKETDVTTTPDAADLIELLDTVYGYDFIYEVLQVRQIGSRVEIDYRGTCGEYGTLLLPDTSIGALMDRLL